MAKLNRDDAVALLEATDQDGRRLTVRELIQRSDAVEQSLRGQAVDATGEPICLAELAWVPDEGDLTEDARRSMNSAAPMGRLRSAWISGYLRALIWADQESAFLPGRWQL